MNNVLESIYYDPSKGYCSSKELFEQARKIDPSLTLSTVIKWLCTQSVYTRHKYARRHYPRNKILVSDIDEQWQMDLVDLSSLANYNNGYKYLLNCIDVLSKFSWSVPLKSKTGTAILDAFSKILESERKPQKIQTDAGTEFMNKLFQSYLKKLGISFFTTNSETKASIVERFNRTLKERMWRYFTRKNTFRYIEILPDLLRAYNNSKHRTIGMPPANVDDENKAVILERMHSDNKKLVKYKLNIDDKVRISKVKGIFEKGYTPNWSEEIFIVHDRKTRQPPVYIIKDQLGEIVQGIFYEQELQKVDTTLDDVFLIEKIIKTRKKAGKVEHFVKWRGYPEKFNSWVKKLIKV